MWMPCLMCMLLLFTLVLSTQYLSDHELLESLNIINKVNAANSTWEVSVILISLLVFAVEYLLFCYKTRFLVLFSNFPMVANSHRKAQQILYRLLFKNIFVHMRLHNTNITF